MRSRIFFAAIAGFWLVMNFLLWRSQSAAHSQIGSAVPVAVVWDKILTAPDNSSLNIYDRERKIGFCQWTATIGNAAQALDERLSEDYAPDGLIPEPTGYDLGLNGNAEIFGTNRVRFDAQVRLSTNEAWQDFRLTARVRPTAVDIHAIAAAQRVMVKVNSDEGAWQRAMKFSELEHPEALLAEFGVPDFPGLDSAAGQTVAAGLHWQAHEDWLNIGHSRARVYRLETEFLGQPIRVFTSRAGEILWVDGPNKITLRNEAFSHL
jgi:hypothetical protein